MSASREYPTRPLVGVGAVVRREGRVLLVQRGQPPRRGEWSLPGGLQEPGETFLAAAEREVMEETGVAARARAMVEAIDLIERDDAGGVRYHFVLIGVACDWQEGEACAGGDAGGVAWAGQDDLDRFGVRPETAAIIAKALALAW